MKGDEMGLTLDRVTEGGADIFRIGESSVLLVVDELVQVPAWRHPAWALLRGLAAVGFGEIQLCGAADSVEEFSFLMSHAMFVQVPQLASLGSLADGSTPFNLILYLGNDPSTRERCASAARAIGAPLRAISWGTTWLAMQSRSVGEEGAWDSGFPPRRTSPEALPPVTRIAAGLALQEALIVAGRVEAAVTPDPVVSFDATSETRSAGGNAKEWDAVELEVAVVEVLGAGGVGTHLLESLAPLLAPGSELRVYDFDWVGPENLPVQSVFGPDDVGRPKAEVMAEKLASLCDPTIAIEPFVMRYEDRPSTLSTPSLRVVCPDTFAARAHANDRSLRDGVPLVEAGTSPLVGQQRSYLRGVSPCLEHRIPDLKRRVAEERDRAACGYEHAVTLPGTNMLTGGLLALEALRALDPKRLGLPSAGTIVYDGRFPGRFGVIDVRPPCIH